MYKILARDTPELATILSYYIQQIKGTDTAVHCQWFCSDYYARNCTWWIYDETTRYCKIFFEPQEELYDDCSELGFSVYPLFSECQTIVDAENNENCDVNI